VLDYLKITKSVENIHNFSIDCLNFSTVPNSFYPNPPVYRQAILKKSIRQNRSDVIHAE